MQGPNQVLTVVQFTDTHFFESTDGRLMGVDTASTFAQVAKLAGEQSGKPDFYLLTGDLSQDETEGSYTRFAQAVKHFEAPAYFLPGNHDARALMERAFARSAPFSNDSSFTKANWHVVLLDTQVPGEVGGRLSEEELTRLDDELSAHPDKHVLVTMHHHPLLVGASWLDEISVTNRAQFLDVIDRHPHVRAVLWGHVHQEFEAERKGVKYMATPSTCVQFKPKSEEFALDNVPPGYRWMRLNPDGSIDTGVSRVEQLAAGLDMASAGY
jgi:Icc protein